MLEALLQIQEAAPQHPHPGGSLDDDRHAVLQDVELVLSDLVNPDDGAPPPALHFASRDRPLSEMSPDEYHELLGLEDPKDPLDLDGSLHHLLLV